MTENNKHIVLALVKKFKRGWACKGMRFYIGHRRAYRDPHF